MTSYALVVVQDRKWVSTGHRASVYGALLGVRDSTYGHIPIKNVKILVLESDDPAELETRLEELNRKKRYG
jgi:hypothetical protein